MLAVNSLKSGIPRTSKTGKTARTIFSLHSKIPNSCEVKFSCANVDDNRSCRLSVAMRISLWHSRASPSHKIRNLWTPSLPRLARATRTTQETWITKDLALMTPRPCFPFLMLTPARHLSPRARVCPTRTPALGRARAAAASAGAPGLAKLFREPASLMTLPGFGELFPETRDAPSLTMVPGLGCILGEQHTACSVQCTAYKIQYVGQVSATSRTYTMSHTEDGTMCAVQSI